MIPIIGAIAAALLVGVFYFTFFQNLSDKSKPIISADKQTILVMNFENLTKDEDNGFLVTGITTSIRSVLNNTESVKVLPSSTTNFIAKNKYDNTQIYEKYGFDFILRGNVQGAGKKIMEEALKFGKEMGYKRIVTLSPLTPMATHYHIRNGAKLLGHNPTTQNFEYTL